MGRSYANYGAVHQVLDAPDILRERAVRASAFLVLLIIARHHGNKDGYCWLSYSTICKETLLNRRTVISAIKELRELGILKVRGDVNKPSNAYSITLSLVSDQNRPGALWSETNKTAPGVLWSQAGSRLFESGALLSGVGAKVHHEVVQGSKSEGGGNEDTYQSPRVNPDCVAQQDGPTETPASPEQRIPCAGDVTQPPTPPPPLSATSIFGAAADSVATEPEQLAFMFFGFQGCPANFDDQPTFDIWVTKFARLIKTYGFNDVEGTMRWAFEVDAYWPSFLIRTKDPLGYFEKQFREQLLTRFLGWKTGQDNAAKRQKKGNTNGKPAFNSNRDKQSFDHQASADEAKRLIAIRLGGAS